MLAGLPLAVLGGVLLGPFSLFLFLLSPPLQASELPGIAVLGFCVPLLALVVFRSGRRGGFPAGVWGLLALAAVFIASMGASAVMVMHAPAEHPVTAWVAGETPTPATVGSAFRLLGHLAGDLLGDDAVRLALLDSVDNAYAFFFLAFGLGMLVGVMAWWAVAGVLREWRGARTRPPPA